MSDAYSVVYSPEAKADLPEIYTYVAFDLQSPGTAEDQVNRIVTVIRIFYCGRDAEGIVNEDLNQVQERDRIN